MFRPWLPGFIILLICPLLWAQSPAVEVQGLFTGAAVLTVNGQSKMLRVGQSHGGVTLIEATSKAATVEIDGKRHVLTVSRRITSNYQKPEFHEVSIRRDTNLQYQTNATINGRKMRVLVDTGANLVALNSSHAQLLGLDYKDGRPVMIETASGVVAAWMITLKSVDVGGIGVESVRASVIEGAYPSTILLGMSYLRHVDISENGGVLSLSRAY